MPRRGEQPPVLDGRRLRGSAEDRAAAGTSTAARCRPSSTAVPASSPPIGPGARPRRHHLIRHWVAPAADLTLGENTVDVAT